MLPGVLALKFGRLAVDRRGASVYLGLVSERLLPLGIDRGGRPALGLALVRHGSSLARLRALASRKCLGIQVRIVHTYTVPSSASGNQGGIDMIGQSDRVSLLEARPDLARHLTADELADLKGITLPVVQVEPGPLEFDGLLASYRAFGATVLDGIVTASLSVGEHAGIHLLGPGDVLVTTSEPWPMWLGESTRRASSPVRLGLFGNELLTAAYRSPRLVEGLYVWVGDQLQRLTAQLVICQLPRVEDRVMAMLWLLAESWGHVTPSGVRLPLTLTHETLGALVGARRPTVTLALRKLTEIGALVAQDSGWLLVHPPPQAVETQTKVIPAEIFMPQGLWAAPTATPAPAAAAAAEQAYAELRETVRRLHEQHAADVEHVRNQLMRVRGDRLRNSALRERIAAEALTRRRVPPSS